LLLTSPATLLSGSAGHTHHSLPYGLNMTAAAANAQGAEQHASLARGVTE